MNEVETTEATPGARLSAAREKQGLSIEHVAEQLRLSPRYVQRLEGDSDEGMPAQPFVLGYLRNYGKLLGLDVNELVVGFYRHRDIQEPQPSTLALPDSRKVSTLRSSEPKRTGWLYLLALIILVGIWFIYSALYLEPAPVATVAPLKSAPVAILPASSADQSDDVTLDEPAATQEARVETEPATAVELLATNKSDADLAVDGPLIVEDEDISVEPPESASVVASQSTSAAIISAATPASSTEGDQLVIEFAADCWVEVTDGKGASVVKSLYRGGQTATLYGISPFAVMLGNARAATVRFNGREVPFVVPEGRTTWRLDIKAVESGAQ